MAALHGGRSSRGGRRHGFGRSLRRRTVSGGQARNTVPKFDRPPHRNDDGRRLRALRDTAIPLSRGDAPRLPRRVRRRAHRRRRTVAGHERHRWVRLRARRHRGSRAFHGREVRARKRRRSPTLARRRDLVADPGARRSAGHGVETRTVLVSPVYALRTARQRGRPFRPSLQDPGIARGYGRRPDASEPPRRAPVRGPGARWCAASPCRTAFPRRCTRGTPP